VKQYCQCKDTTWVGKSLQMLPESLKGDFIQVHPNCMKPFRGYWESFIHRCEGCLREFSNPYELLCRNCFQTEMESDPSLNGSWRSWRWVGAHGVYAWEQGQRGRYGDLLDDSSSIEPLEPSLQVAGRKLEF
jgi:hypothetical protein